MASTAKEDYVRALYVLREREDLSLTSLAAYLAVSKASASEMMRTLAADGYVIAEPYRPLRLTPRGSRFGRQLTYKHRVIESFLHEVLGMPKARIHDQAHLLEHACSDETIELMRKKLRPSTKDPHGAPIPLAGVR